MLERIFIIAHFGQNGQRGQIPLLETLNRYFAVNGLGVRVKQFIKRRFLCAHVKGPNQSQRPWAETFRSNIRYEAIHFDFLHIGESNGSSMYVLAMKDDASHYCVLRTCDKAGSDEVMSTLLDWHKRFGLPKLWNRMAEAISRIRYWKKWQPR